MASVRVVLGFRPESVVIGGEIPAVVRVVEDLGAEVFVHLGIDHEGQTFVGRQGRRAVPGIVGEATSIRIAGAVHVFDPGGQRLDDLAPRCAIVARMSNVQSRLITGAAGDIGRATGRVLAEAG